MFRLASPRPRYLAACLALSLSFGCAAEESKATSANEFDEASCDTSFEARASRAGNKRQARLSYGCTAEVCGADEALASGTIQLVTIDVPTTQARSLQISSSDAAIIQTISVQAALDPCLGLTRAYVSLAARGEGEASLSVTADGVTDELPVQVRAPSSVSLRASSLKQFDLTVQDVITIEAGEPWLIVPALRAVDGAQLRGLPALTWSVVDETLAEVRMEANTDDESFVRDWAAPSAVFLDAKSPGTTQVYVRTEDGTEGLLTVNIVPASYAKQ